MSYGLRAFLVGMCTFVHRNTHCTHKTHHSLDHLEHWSKGFPLMSKAQASLRSLAGVEHLLEHLLESLQAAATAITTALLPFQRGKGLDSLPDDVLSMIFVYVGSSFRLTGVCRRFRQVAFGIPQLWCTINTRMFSMRFLHASLKESKAAGLNIELDLNGKAFGNHLDALQVVDASLAHVDRWEHLDVSSSEIDSWEEIGPLIIEIDERTKGIHAPRLRSLSIDFNCDFPHGEGIPDRLDSAIHFYRTWTLPNLRHLQADNFVPIPFIAPSLTSISIELESPSEYIANPRSHSLRRLLDFLASIPYLEDLNLLLEWLDDESVLSPVVLYHLKTFRVQFAFWTPLKVSLFAKALATPAIRCIHLSIQGQFDPEPIADPTEWLSSFFSSSSTYPTLEEFTFKFDTCDDSLEFLVPFKRFPNLRALTLESGDWSPGNFYYDFVPPLRSLHLKGRIDTRWTDWVSHVQEQMRSQGTLAGLQDLSISVLGNLNEEWTKKASKFPNCRINCL